MSPWKERRLLTSVLAAEHRPLPSARRQLLVHVITWILLAAAIFCVFHFYGVPTVREWIWAIGAFVLGAFIGALAIYDASREQWPVLRRYIDFERVKARLSDVDN